MFNRAEIPLKHSEGFNPHPLLSIVLPLSLGQESVCEFLDVTFEDEVGSFLRLPERLNPYLPNGIRITRAAVPLMKPGDIALVRSELTAVSGAWNLPAANITVEKKTKSGNIRQIEVDASALERVGETTIACTLPSDVSPQLLANTLGVEYCEIRRAAVFDGRGKEFE
jgi:radical SAM-linked protein